MGRVLPGNSERGYTGGSFDLGGGWVALPPVIGSVSLVSNKEGGTRGRGGEEVNPHSFYITLIYWRKVTPYLFTFVNPITSFCLLHG
jgi:hypothetical protein